jgi:glycosyltransferase involved in cell wall biosynthesis|tara:strand:+ start:587 stop:1252 length:666 start_codon:yes stop_codon:yes gene_type:complete
MKKKNTVSVSVIIPVYNQELYISRCLRSLLDQSIDREKYEIIVINDGSKDRTQEILKTYKNEIELINNKKNKGLPYSLNKGIKASKGRFIVRVDSDDYVNKEFLNYLQMHLLYNNEMDAICCDYYLVDDQENILKKKNSMTDPIGCAIMFRTENLIKIGMYDKSFNVHEDKDLRIRFLKHFNINRISLPLYRYRRHANNITKDSVKMMKHYKRLLKKYKKI